MPSMKTLQLLLLVLLPGLLTGSSNALTQCSYSEGILLPQDVTTSNDTPGCVVTIRDRQDCRTINEIMNSYNDIVGPGECVQFLFQPGEYFITSSTPVVLNYSLEMRAVDSGVSFSCDLTGTLDETGQASVSRTPIVFRRGLQETVVSLVGVDFHDCQALQFDDLDIVTITDCTFRNFLTSAVDVFNCGEVTVERSSFTNCTASLGKAQFRANSGGLSIGYHTNASTHTHPPAIAISECTFANNSVILPHQNSTEQINLALNNQYYFGRGGGCGIFLDEFFVNITVLIEDSTFIDNFAESFGGGLYLYLDGDGTQHHFVVRRCNFTGNYATEGSFSVGGGLQIALLLRNTDLTPSTFAFSQCHFERNSADFGGGISTVQTYSQGAGNIVTVTECTFIGNRGYQVGSAIMFGSLLYVQNRVESYHYLARDCTFLNNNSPGGTFAIGFIHVNFTGTTVIANNTGPGLRVFGSLVTVKGTLQLLGNNAQTSEGGAMYIQAFGQVKLYDGAVVDFRENRGRIGSAIVVDVQRSSDALSELIFNSQCFLLNPETTEAPVDWNTSVIYFHGNEASVGPAVFISHLRHCSWFSVERIELNSTNQITVAFSIQNFTRWPVFNYRDDSNMATSHAEDPSGKQFYFQTEATHLLSDYNTSKPITIWPGQQQRLNLRGIDQFGNPTYIIVRLSDRRANINPGAFSQATSTNINDTENDNDAVQFQPSLIPVQPSDEAVTVSYGFPRPVDPLEIHTGETFRVIVDSPLNVRDSETFEFTVQFADCLPGYELRQRVAGDNLHACVCDESSTKILDCENDVIVLRDGHWAGPEPEPVPHLDFYPCPPGHCRCHRRDGPTCETLFFQDDPNHDMQCHPTRRGTLCGECINGTGAGVLRTNCRHCDKENYWALGFLVIGDFVLVLLILFSAVKWHLYFPHSLKGLLFYIQSVYYVTAYFPSSFWDIRKYMLYVSSALGLYFPWDFCLYPAMPALVSFAPRFVPATVAVLISGSLVAFMFARRSQNVAIARARAIRKHVWRGMWSLLLLLYTPLAFTSVTLLHCPELPSVEGEDEAHRWFLAAQVVCFREPGHIVLGLVAIAFLVILVLMVPAVCLFTLLGKAESVQQHSIAVEYLYCSLTQGYRESARWWGGWELARRLLLVVLVVSLPGRSVFPLFVIVPAFGLHVFVLPYKKWWQNAIEAGVLLNYVLLLLIRATQPFLDNLSSYSGTEIPAERGPELAALDGVSWLLFTFYYLPLACGVCFCTAVLGWHSLRFLRQHCYTRPKDLNIQADFSDDYAPVISHAHRHSSFAITSDYHPYDADDLDSVPVDMEKVTFTELEMKEDVVPVYDD